MADTTTYIGIAAGVCTGVSMLPQLIKILREKKAESISFFMLLVLIAGLAGWIWYGLLKDDLPILITNAFSLITNILITAFSIKYKGKN